MKTIKILTLATLSVFAPISSLLAITLVLVIADLILGIMAAKKRKEPVRYSRALRRTFTKAVVYEIAIMLAFLTSSLTGPLLPVVSVITSYAGLTELISCLENLNELAGGSLLNTILAKLGAIKQREDSSPTKEDN